MNDGYQVALWLQWNEDGSCEPMYKIFAQDDLGGALKFTEALRRSVYTKEPVRDPQTGFEYGTGITHVALTGGVIGNVTKPGVDVVDANYNWMKRRSQ